MGEDADHDRYTGIESLPGDPLNPRKPQPFRVDGDGSVVYLDEASDAAGPTAEEKPHRLAQAGILGWDELDRKVQNRSAQPTAEPLLTTTSLWRGDAARDGPALTRRTINGIDYDVISATTFDPNRSNGATAVPSKDMMWAADANKRDAAVPYGTAERGAFLTRAPSPLPWSDRLKIGRAKPGEEEANWNVPMQDYYFSVPLINPKTGSTEVADTLDFGPRMNYAKGTAALSHGHIDDGPLDSRGREVRSDGMVDYVDPRDEKSYGDSSSSVVERPLPLATVSQDRVGWHFIENGQLKFMYPVKSLDDGQKKKIQDNLDTA